MDGFYEITNQNTIYLLTFSHDHCQFGRYCHFGHHCGPFSVQNKNVQTEAKI